MGERVTAAGTAGAAEDETAAATRSIDPMAEHAWQRAQPAATPWAPSPRAVR